ncbi:P-loop containing nucleoside triphosphate hydrolase protein [Chytridium lagenaria]|nr:P-loop containing nucleoside triphosphate hydrolase protein [Chytridium lagenaria]
MAPVKRLCNWCSVPSLTACFANSFSKVDEAGKDGSLALTGSEGGAVMVEAVVKDLIAGVNEAGGVNSTKRATEKEERDEWGCGMVGALEEFYEKHHLALKGGGFFWLSTTFLVSGSAVIMEAIRQGLPIYQHRDDLLKATHEHQVLVVVGDTGSGKTTQFPQYLHEHDPNLRILVTQPRRIAAISAATRVAEETSTSLGGPTVGYSIRFESLRTPTTKIVYMTDGTLLRTAASTDPTLSSLADVVILDEAHERERKDLRLVVMSATLNVEKFSEFFDEAPVYGIPGRMYKVDIFYARKSKMASLKPTFIQKTVDAVIQVHKSEEPGDILVFLTGQQEIETPETGYRKVIVATNIAQTSVTIPGIRYVVDCGFVKEKSFDPKTGVDALLVVPIVKQRATQRAGRAGVFRLYSKEAFDEFQEDTIPEIQRSSLLGTTLSLKKIGINDVLNFEFIDPPDRDMVLLPFLPYVSKISKALSTKTATSPPLAKRWPSFLPPPTSPAAVLAACETFGCGDELITLAAMLSSEDPYLSPRGDDKKSIAEMIHARFGHPSGDHLALIRLYHAWRRAGEDSNWCRDRYLRSRALRSARSVRDQLQDVVRKMNLDIRSCRKRYEDTKQKKRETRYLEDEKYTLPEEDHLDDFDHIPILKSICAGFFVNTGKRHAQLPCFYHYLSASGHGITNGSSATSSDSQSSLLSLHVHPSSCLAGVGSGMLRGLDWVVYNDVQYVMRANLRIVSRIDFSWVEEGLKRVATCDVNRIAKIKAKPRKESVDAGGKKRRASLGAVDQGTAKKVAGDPKPNGGEVKKDGGGVVVPVITEVDRDAKAEAAKARYLARKKEGR